MTLVNAYGMAKEGLGKIGQKLRTIITVILALGPGARKAVEEAFRSNFEDDLPVSFSARDLGVDATMAGPKRTKVLRKRVFAIGGISRRVMALPVGAPKRAKL
eukprot:1855694-Heterocapsa_arctica.AAC.1